MIGSDTLSLFPGSQTLLGKQVSELVGDDLMVKADGSVVGTFHHVTGYTEFSSEPDEQEGYYFPFHLTKTGSKMTFKKMVHLLSRTLHLTRILFPGYEDRCFRSVGR